VKTLEFGKPEGRTAGPSATLGMTKGWVALSVEIGLRMIGTADPSATLRSGPTAGRDRRDDTSVSGVGV
jgi:hypothetical protein